MSTTEEPSKTEPESAASASAPDGGISPPEGEASPPDGDGQADPTIAADPVAPGTAEDDLDDKRMTLLEHLAELRVRLRNAAIAFLAAMLGSFFFVQRFFVVLTKPVCDGLKMANYPCEFNFANITEPFWVYMKLAIVAGIMIASPFVFWELWKFVAPGLYKKEKRLAGLLTGATAFCFAGGALFGYGVLARPAAYYMVKLAEAPGLVINPMLMMDQIGNFLMLTLAGCGAAFELPVVISILGWMGVVSAKGLFKFNKYALVLSVVAGAVLTPSTDPFTQLLLAGPLFGLYNVSILIVWLIERARRKQEAELEKEYEKKDDKKDGQTGG